MGRRGVLIFNLWAGLLYAFASAGWVGVVKNQAF
jgi:hypothetical protein